MDTKYAVITGASQGLGKALAISLAKRKIPLILTGLAQENLPELAKHITKNYQVKVAYKEADLSNKQQVLSFCNWINDNFSVFMLINNAGIGGTKKFEKATAPYLNAILQLNIVATSLITHQLLPNLLQQQKAYILNIASMAAFTPIGYKTVYPASKSFIDSFTKGLREEFKDSPLHLSIAYPGPMRTNANVSKRIDKQGFLGKLGLIAVETIAERCIEQTLGRKNVIHLSIGNSITKKLMQWIPKKIQLPLVSHVIKKELELESVS